MQPILLVVVLLLRLLLLVLLLLLLLLLLVLLLLLQRLPACSDALEALPVDCTQLVMQHHSILADPVCLLLLAPDLLVHALQEGDSNAQSSSAIKLSVTRMITRTACMQRTVPHAL
jgi:hypothetical protein